MAKTVTDCLLTIRDGLQSRVRRFDSDLSLQNWFLTRVRLDDAISGDCEAKRRLTMPSDVRLERVETGMHDIRIFNTELLECDL